MYFGADYYPEHWPEARWPIDAKLMREAGFNLVRVAEFAWSKLEPAEGVWDFSWLDRALEVLFKEQIQVVMGTPTATPPKWLMDRYPGIYKVDENGLRQGFGSRRHYCYNSEVYREYTEKIVEKMAQHYRGHPAVAVWQIDNEFTCGDGLYCYCEECRQKFIQWLKNKYGSLGALNQAWGTVFWSQIYTDWDQLIVPAKSQAAHRGNNGHNPALNLDYARFSSDAVVDYCALQSRILRRHVQVPITHNIVSELFDYYKMGEQLDFTAFDNYPQLPWNSPEEHRVYDPALSMDIHRGIKRQNIWVMEEQSGPCGWDVLGSTPRPGQIKQWTYQALAHGAEAMVYFRWRACLFGTEQYWYGILDHDGIPRRRYAEIQEIGKSFPELSKYNVGSKVDTDILMVRSFEQEWSHQFQAHNWNFKYRDYLRSLYAGLYTKHFNVDVSNVETDFSAYKLVIAPAFNLMSDELKAKFEAYVREGGNLLITFRSGTRHQDNSMTEETLPGYFRQLAGIELEEFDSMHGYTVPVEGVFGQGQAAIWADIIKPESAEVLAAYQGEYYAGKPAITVNSYGKGRCFYVGCDLDEAATAALMDYVARASGAAPALEGVPDGVEVMKKIGLQGRQFYFVMNFNKTEQIVSFPQSVKDLLSGKELGNQLIMPAYGSLIVG